VWRATKTDISFHVCNALGSYILERLAYLVGALVGTPTLPKVDRGLSVAHDQVFWAQSHPSLLSSFNCLREGKERMKDFFVAGHEEDEGR
jgi:hypothetical protein